MPTVHPANISDRQVYLNGCKLTEGSQHDFIMTPEDIPALCFHTKASDVLVVVVFKDGQFIETPWDPLTVHRLCDSCSRTTQPQEDTQGDYEKGFPKSVCKSCTLKSVTAALKDTRAQLKERSKQLTQYRKLRTLALKRKGIPENYRDLILTLDGATRMIELCDATYALVERTRDEVTRLKCLHSRLKSPKKTKKRS